MNEWHDLFVATAGAAAALTGLIFVGVSINLQRILSLPKLPERAMVSLIHLSTILVVSVILLIPNQPYITTGIEALISTMLTWIIVTRKDVSIYKNTETKFKRLQLFNLIFDQVAILPYLIGAVLFLNSREFSVNWIVLSIILGFIKALLDAWVLLIEINR